MLSATFDDKVLNWTTVFVRHSRFKAARHSFEDDKVSGRPSTSKTEIVEQIEKLIWKARRLTSYILYSVVIQDAADKYLIIYEICQKLLRNNLSMQRTAVKFVVRLPGNDQRGNQWIVLFWTHEKTNDYVRFISKIIPITKVGHTSYRN